MPYLYRKAHTLVGGDLTANRVNGGGWARPASDFSLDGSSPDGATLPGPCPMNCTNGEQVAGQSFPLAHYGTEGTGEAYSFHPVGANFVFADGAVRLLSADISLREFAKLVSRSDFKDIKGIDF
jgi:prepilin-type processing-associated H-X9-DG protein